MKAEDVAAGDYRFGTFQISVRDSSRAGFFEVLVQDEQHCYVDLHVRFDWFGHLARFERNLAADDLEEYNARVGVIFHKIAMPTWRLSSHSVVRLEKLCVDASKKTGKKS